MIPPRLDPDAAALLAVLDRDFANLSGADVDSQRALLRATIARLTDDEAHHFDGTETDEVITRGGHRVPVRRYTPRDAVPGTGLVHIHGGGWVYGDVDTAERLARSLARTLRVTVLSVDYRRAPEHPFPAALDDCRLVAETAREQFPQWCGLAGDSAGGNLAAATALAADPARRYDGLVLLYPCLDAAMSGATYDAYAVGYGLTRDVMAFYWDAYAAAADRSDPLLSPLAAPSLTELPPTVVVTAGFDVLRADGERFAQRLVEAGVEVTCLPYPTLPHGFADFVDGVAVARLALDDVLGAALRLVDRRHHVAPPSTGPAVREASLETAPR